MQMIGAYGRKWMTMVDGGGGAWQKVDNHDKGGVTMAYSGQPWKILCRHTWCESIEDSGQMTVNSTD